MQIEQIISNEKLRQELFPICTERVFLAHAGVTALPQCSAEAMKAFSYEGSLQQQEHAGVWKDMFHTRQEAATLLSAEESEIALLGPTALGLNLVANGLKWQKGDEVIYYGDCYPADVYPWIKLRSHGVEVVPLELTRAGVIRWEHIEEKLTERTRLVSLASANFLSGYRINLEEIGSEIKKHNPQTLFCVDGIQTLGAFKTTVEHIDFLSADSHKWLLGPLGAGVFYVKKSLFNILEPTLLGSWNVVSPQFIAQDRIDYYEGARRYEPGSLNLVGNVGMLAGIRFLLELGVENISKRIRDLGAFTTVQMLDLGYQRYVDFDPVEENGHQATCGIYTFQHPSLNMEETFQKLKDQNIDISLRYNRSGQALFRISPHFYNTEEEISRFIEVLKKII
ncbi:MAG: aminotransferase class V-fold PLP-dependent enzyme [Verrucomicrobiota bacterium]